MTKDQKDAEEIVLPTDVELPEYQCHKKVRAAKIVDIYNPSANGNAQLHLDVDGVKATRIADQGWMGKHRPEVGGYFVEYEKVDDVQYTSFSPAEPFEAGYSLNGDDPKTNDG